MPITGSTALAIVAAPSANSPKPYTIYTVTNLTGVALAGFILTNTTNIPVAVSIFQDNYNNTIYSTTLASGASVTVPMPTNLAAGETILAVANQGGVVNIEIDGILNNLDPTTQLMQGLMFMLSDAFGVQIPSQNMLNAGAYTF